MEEDVPAEDDGLGAYDGGYTEENDTSVSAEQSVSTTLISTGSSQIAHLDNF